MPDRIKLDCRSCERESVFATVEQAQESLWTNTSPLGLLKDTGTRVHNSYCPSCAGRMSAREMY